MCQEYVKSAVYRLEHKPQWQTLLKSHLILTSKSLVFSEISKNMNVNNKTQPSGSVAHIELVNIWNFSISDFFFFSCLFQSVSASSTQRIKKPLAGLFSLPVDSKWSLPGAWWIEFPVSKACDFKENNEQRPKNPLSDFIMRERF